MVLRLGLTAATIAVLAGYLHSRPRPDLSALAWRWGHLAWACALAPVLIALRALKWKALLRGAAPDVGFGQSLRSYLGALSLGLVTPARVGEFSRGLYLPQPALQGWRTAGLVLIDNWLDFLSVLAWACLGWAAVGGVPGLAAGIVLCLICAPIVPWLRGARRVAGVLPMAASAKGAAERALSAGEAVARRDWVSAGALAWTAYGLEWLQAALWVGFLAPAEPSLWRLAGLMALVTLANSFQVTLAGMGIREGLAAFLLARVGVSAEAAVLAAFLQTVVNLFAPALAGLLCRPVALAGSAVQGDRFKSTSAESRHTGR
jgi:hypothetical protein